VRLLYGPRWAASARLAQVLGLMAVPFTINYFAGPALAALGRSGTLAKIATLQLTLTVVLSLLAAPFGLTAIAGAYVLRAYLTLPVQMGAFKRYSGIGYGALLGAIAPPLSMALVMAGCLMALDYLVGARFHNRGLFLLLMVCTGTTVYAASLFLFARNFVSQQLRDLRRLLPSVSAKLSGAGA
jgi:O-antigen/teichoic acid export membrane protein